MKNDKKEIISEYLRGGISYRELAKKHGISHAAIAKMVQKVLDTEKQLQALTTTRALKPIKQSMGLVELRKELRETQLRNRLLETLLDIGEETYGIPLRKKAGTKRS